MAAPLVLTGPRPLRRSVPEPVGAKASHIGSAEHHQDTTQVLLPVATEAGSQLLLEGTLEREQRLILRAPKF